MVWGGALSDQKSAVWSHLLPVKGGQTQFSFTTFQKWDVVFPVTWPDLFPWISPLSVVCQGPEEFCRGDQLGNR